MKNYLKYICSIGLVFLLMFSLCFTSFASVQSLMIRTNSNAFSTFNLPRSSIATIANTVDWSPQRTVFRVQLINTSTGAYINEYKYPTSCSLSDGLRFKYTAPTGYDVYRLYVYNVILGDYSDSPRPGTYDWSIDISSALSHSYSTFGVISAYQSDNVAEIEGTYTIPKDYYTVNSGDAYISNLNITIGSGLERFGFRMGFAGTRPKQLDLAIKESFIYAQPGDDNIATIKPDVSSDQLDENYQNDVSSSLSNISSSVGEVSEGISGITEAIENLQGAMEPHYSNVLTQLHHITEQLHAFYDQVYNNIHLAQMNLLGQIKEAIENIDLEVNVNLDKLKTSIDNMSTAIQNKLQSVTDTITGGFDNSSIEQNGNELDSSITEFEEAEQNVLESVNDSLNDFEFDADLSEYKNIVQVISDFLQELYESSGGFKLVINLSLMLSVASIVIGVYRFKEGG